MIPRLLLITHRYLGLLLAALLIVAGLSGSILAFDPELDALLNPELFRIEETGRQRLPPSELAERIEATDRRIRVRYIPLAERAASAIVVYVDPRIDPLSGEPFDVDYDEVFVNPVTGQVNGSRMWGECCERRNFVPFVFKLHNRLLMPSGTGRPVMGAVAILWAVTTIIGIVLSAPSGRRAARDWMRVVLPRRGASGRYNSLQLHRATGLWWSLVFLIVALSGVALALDHQLFRPVVGVFSPIGSTVWEERARSGHEETVISPITYDDALAMAREHAASIRLDRSASEISYSVYRGLYRVGFGSRLEAGPGISEIYVDASTGEVAGDSIAGRGSAGDILNLAVQPLHSGRIAGMPGRIVVFLSGFALSLLAYLGCLVWLRKRRRGT